MNREEAIEALTRIKWVYVGNELFEAEKEQAIDIAIEALNREPSEDGTLEVKVEDATKIGRVLISDDKHRGGLYYPDEDEPKGEPMKTTDYCDICKRDMCEFCVADNANPYCVPSHYEIKQDEPQKGDLISRTEAYRRITELSRDLLNDDCINLGNASEYLRIIRELPSADRPTDGDLISRAEAIEAIELVDWYHQNSNKDMVHGANDYEHQAWYKADDVYKALEAVPSADRQMVIKCKPFLSEEDFKAFAEQASDQNVILISNEAEVVSTNTSTNTSTKSTNISTDTSADRPRGEWVEETSWKYKKGGRNSDMKEILGTEWMTMIRQRCSECNKVTMVDGSILYKYCPHCGSEMRSE